MPIADAGNTGRQKWKGALIQDLRAPALRFSYPLTFDDLNV